MAILVTNDDGYSEGLKVLYEVAQKFGKSYAIIPDRQQSAVSKSLTLHKALRLHKLHDRGHNIHTINGTPADCVLFSVYSKEFPKPILVLSGINYGDNTSLGAILSSGTLAACWEATLEGIPSIGFSIHKPESKWKMKNSWGDLEKMRDKIHHIIKMLKNKHAKDSFFSVSLPFTFSDKTKIVFTNKVQRNRFKTSILKRRDPYGGPYYWLCGDFSNAEKGKDLYEVAVKKNIVITKVSLDFVK